MSKESAEDKLKKMIAASSPATPAAKSSSSDVARQMSEAVHGNSMSDYLPAYLVNFGLKELYQVLRIGVVIVCVWIGLEIFWGLSSSRGNVDFSISSSASRSEVSRDSSPQPLNYYIAQVDRRNIFRPFERKVVDPAAGQAAGGAAISGRLSERFRLVGISWANSEHTALAMIEDKLSNDAYFVHQGEKVKELTVQSIYADRVVLTNQDEEITIKYEINQK